MKRFIVVNWLKWLWSCLGKSEIHRADYQEGQAGTTWTELLSKGASALLLKVFQLSE